MTDRPRPIHDPAGEWHPGEWHPDDGSVRPAVRAAFTTHGVQLEQLEGSVRHEGSGVIRGGRMMIQRSSAALASALAGAFGVGHDEELIALQRAAASESLPLIAGWDVSGSRAVVKLYVNASDASLAVRRRVLDRLGLSPLVQDSAAPHVIGINVSTLGVETKAYVQSNDALELASRGGELAEALASRFNEVSAGGVLSSDVLAAGVTPRAYFVALRHGTDDVAHAACRLLPGWSDAAVAAGLPFDPGPARTIGVSLQVDGRWTAYFRPRVDDGEHVTSLSPTACFRLESAEVGLFVFPIENSGRAAGRTRRHALSYRIREGRIPGQAIDQLLAWALARVAAAEESTAPMATFLRSPPAPWTAAAE